MLWGKEIWKERGRERKKGNERKDLDEKSPRNCFFHMRKLNTNEKCLTKKKLPKGIKKEVKL